LRVAIFQFLERHLKKDSAKVKDAEFKPLPGKELRVFPEDSDIPADALNARIDETFVTARRVKFPALEDFEDWKEGLIRQLRQKCFRALPEKIPMAKELKNLNGREKEFSAEDGITFSVSPFPAMLHRPRNLITLLVLNPGEDVQAAKKFWSPRLQDSHLCD